MKIREITNEDLFGLLELYTQLHDNPIPENTPELQALWNRIQQDPNHHIIAAEEEGRIVSSCVLLVIPNLTHGQRPYALIENVVTAEKYRGRGFATACLAYARQIAENQNCYKIMLLTGSKEESTLNFYRKAGYNSNDKTAMIQWLS